MGANTIDRRLTDRGVTSIQFLLASALGLLLFFTMANLVVVQYGRGAVRSALDQGARVGAITGTAGACEAKVAEVLDQLLAGTMGEGVSSRCTVGSATVEARAEAIFPSWTPMVGDFVIDIRARAALESLP
jgi:hypothetical protein